MGSLGHKVNKMKWTEISFCIDKVKKKKAVKIWMNKGVWIKMDPDLSKILI